MSQFQIDPTAFGPAGDTMDASVAELLTQWQALRERSLAVQFGEYDVVAPLIQASLMGAVAVADECFASVAEATGAFSEGLRANGEVYAAAEDDTLATVRQQQV